MVDKSLFIKNVLDNAYEVTIIIRPPGFGRTTNLKMLAAFLNGGRSFRGTDINDVDQGRYRKFSGNSPTIYISFKDIDGKTYDESINQFNKLIAKLYHEYLYLLNSEKLSDREKKQFNETMEGKADTFVMKDGIGKLISYLHRYSGKMATVLVDDYDQPLKSCPEMANFMEGLFIRAFKDNNSLMRAILVGESKFKGGNVFAGFNNFVTEDITTNRFSQDFGFTGDEVIRLLGLRSFNDKRENLGGCKIGDKTMYNPKLVIDCIHD